MIFVVERAHEPYKLASGAIAAYGSRTVAERSAKALGGRVCTYSFTGANVVTKADEDLMRSLDDVAIERDQAKLELNGLLDTITMNMTRGGAYPHETLGVFVARVTKGYREWVRMMTSLGEFYREHKANGPGDRNEG